MLDVEQSNQTFGLFGSLRRFSASAMSILQNRLELMMLELKEEKSRLVSIGIFAGAAIFLGSMFLVALMLTLTFVFWEQRIAVMGGFCGFFLVAALVSFFLLKSRIKTPPFAETINQLKKDQRWLQGR